MLLQGGSDDNGARSGTSKMSSELVESKSNISREAMTIKGTKVTYIL